MFNYYYLVIKVKQIVKYYGRGESLILSREIYLDKKEYRYLQNVLQNELEEYAMAGLVKIVNHGRPYLEGNVVGIKNGKVHGLSLSDFELDFLHSDIGKLTSLTFLDISKNNLTYLPETFIDLENLAYFNGMRNNFNEASIKLLKELEKKEQIGSTFNYD